jgi:muramidase (phage lysozyme)
LSGFKQMGQNFEKALSPGGFLHGFREFFDAINRKAGIPGTPTETEIRPPVQGQPSRPITPTPTKPWETLPSFLPPVKGPQLIAPPAKPWESMPSFSQANDNGLISKAAFMPGGAGGQAAGASSRGDAVGIIAAGTRRGVLDGMTDFWQMMRGLNKGGGGGIMPASFETCGGGPGSGAGGLGGGSGGEGAGRGGGGGLPGGPRTPAGRIGHAVRRGRHGAAGGDGAAGPELPPGTGGPLLDEISKSEGTRGYNDAFAHQHPGTDLSKLTIDQVKALAMTQRGSGAIGRYQFMPATLTGLEKELGLSGSEMFTPALQERLARSLLQRRGYDQWKAGKLSDQEFMHNLSKEWAGLTDPYTGRGYYPNQTTGHPLAQQFAALRAERDKANTAVAAAPMPARPVTPTPMSGYDKLRMRLKQLDLAGIKTGREEWEGTNGSIPGAGNEKQFNPRDDAPWGHLRRPSETLPGETHGITGRSLGREASLQRREPGSLLKARNQMQANASATHKIEGEASLRIKLASGLVPDGGVKNKGNLFREIRMDRAPLPLASTMG